MRTQVSKWGNSLAIRLPKAVSETLNVGAGAAVELQIEDGRLVIEPARPKYRIGALVDGITDDNRPDSFDDGPMGKELL